MTSVIEYVLNSFAWSALGFGAGWLVSSLRSDVTTIREAVMHDEAEQTRTRHSHSRAAQRWVGVAIALLALVTVVQGVIASQRLNEISKCQTAYNREFATAVKSRAEIAESDRQALNHLLLSLYQQRDASEQQRFVIFKRWVEKTEANERERARTPLPDYPEGGDC